MYIFACIPMGRLFIVMRHFKACSHVRLKLWSKFCYFTKDLSNFRQVVGRDGDAVNMVNVM